LKADQKTMMLGMVTRLDPQKGLDLVMCVMDAIAKMPVQFVLLGTGDEKYERFFSETGKRYPENTRIFIRFDIGLAQRIYAASDLFLMPSLFEPCGLSQMIAMRYGTLPLVRETGGLKDTVSPYNEQAGTGDGFSFLNYNAHDMLHVIEWARRIYENEPQVWQKLVKNAMRKRFLWDQSAKEYIRVYETVLKGKRQ